ncbi:Coatomer subunit delta [Aphelenchoides besseyi]|nr:Coatomer subunit delta [Aphelenchoides besseyi]
MDPKRLFKITPKKAGDPLPDTASNELTDKRTTDVVAEVDKLSEYLVAKIKRNGALEVADITGSIKLNITEAKYNTVAIRANSRDESGAQVRVPARIDELAWQMHSVLRLKNPRKPFALHTDIDVLNWRLQLKEKALLPLTLSVRSNNSSSGCRVNIEYTLQLQTWY